MDNVNNNEYNPDIVTLTDDEGKEYTFEVLDAIETDMGRYLALLPTFEDPRICLTIAANWLLLRLGKKTVKNISMR